MALSVKIKNVVYTTAAAIGAAIVGFFGRGVVYDNEQIVINPTEEIVAQATFYPAHDTIIYTKVDDTTIVADTISVPDQITLPDMRLPNKGWITWKANDTTIARDSVVVLISYSVDSIYTVPDTIGDSIFTIKDTVSVPIMIRMSSLPSEQIIDSCGGIGMLVEMKQVALNGAETR